MQIEKLKFVKFVSHHLVFLLQNEFNSPKYSQPKKNHMHMIEKNSICIKSKKKIWNIIQKNPLKKY